jgi:type VI secretion system Hcp family effector
MGLVATKNKLVVGAIFVVLAMVGVRGVSAATNIYMQVPGILGESVTGGYIDWIELRTLSQTLQTTTKKDGLCRVVVVKQIDRSSPSLWGSAVTGQHFPSISIEVLSGGGGSPYYQMALKNAQIENLATLIEGEERGKESVTLKSESIEIGYTSINPDGTSDATVTKTISCI